jgi:urea carboxylase
MLAKLMACAPTRELALAKLRDALSQVTLFGSETNVSYLRALCDSDALQQGRMTTRFLDGFNHTPARMDVTRAGTMTTIQDLPGRVGYWSVGIPPSGPFDSLSFSLANELLGNEANCAGLEITMGLHCNLVLIRLWLLPVRQWISLSVISAAACGQWSR